MALEAELKTYESSLQSLLADEGKFVLIKGDQVLGVYETYADAIQSGYEKCELEPFLVRKIEATEHIHFFTRPIEPCLT